jgi:hypothetical protein
LVLADRILERTKDLSTTDPWPSATSLILRTVSIGRQTSVFDRAGNKEGTPLNKSPNRVTTTAPSQDAFSTKGKSKPACLAMSEPSSVVLRLVAS